MARYSTLFFPEILVPNGFHVYVPEPGNTPVSLCNDKKNFICFVALSGSFYLDHMEISENHFYWKIVEPGNRIIKELKASPEITSQLLIINLDPEILPEQILRFPELNAAMNIQALKALVNLPIGNNKSAATSVTNRLTIDTFIYSTCFHLEKVKTTFTFAQIKMIHEWIEGLNTRNRNVSRISKSRFEQICKQLYRRSPKKLEREVIMQRSMEALINTSKTLDRLALESGYRSREFFITAFKKHFGISPGRLRNRLRSLSSNFPS